MLTPKQGGSVSKTLHESIQIPFWDASYQVFNIYVPIYQMHVYKCWCSCQTLQCSWVSWDFPDSVSIPGNQMYTFAKTLHLARLGSSHHKWRKNANAVRCQKKQILGFHKFKLMIINTEMNMNKRGTLWNNFAPSMETSRITQTGPWFTQESLS